MSKDTTTVVFALDYETEDGKKHKGGAEAAVDSHEARALVLKGVAQYKGVPPVPAATDSVGPADTTKGGK